MENITITLLALLLIGVVTMTVLLTNHCKSTDRDVTKLSEYVQTSSDSIQLQLSEINLKLKEVYTTLYTPLYAVGDKVWVDDKQGVVMDIIADYKSEPSYVVESEDFIEAILQSSITAWTN